MSTKKPQPLFDRSSPAICPRCGHATYSAGGIHPQCAVSQADAPRSARLLAKRKEVAKEKAEARLEIEDE